MNEARVDVRKKGHLLAQEAQNFKKDRQYVNEENKNKRWVMLK